MQRIPPLLAFLLLTLLALGGATAQAPAGFQVIIHPDNPTTTMTRSQVARLLLKKTTQWPDGVAAEPVDRQPNATVRERFSRAIHRRDVGSIVRYWQRQFFAGRDVPPPELSSDDEIVAFVRARRGAIGYVSAEADTTGVGTLDLTEVAP